MLSCGICFEMRSGSDKVETEYVAPDLLPEAWEKEARDERWGDEPADYETVFYYDALPPALMRNLIGRIGGRAERIRVFAQEDAAIWSLGGRAHYAIHWRSETEKLDRLVREHGIQILGDRDKIAFGNMNKISVHIGDILNTVADVQQPRNLEELIDYSF